MSEDQPETKPNEQSARPSHTIRLSAEEMKALLAQAQQGQPQPEKKPWED